MSIHTPPITPQQYEVLPGGGAEAAKIAKQRLSRRWFLRRSLLAIFGLSATTSVAGAVNLLYPDLAGQFGAVLILGTKVGFPAARPGNFKIGQVGVFYHEAKTYIVHLLKIQRSQCWGQCLRTSWPQRQSSKIVMVPTGLDDINGVSI
jgi:cytochrome b6-f complex iron-sulfur subunit